MKEISLASPSSSSSYIWIHPGPGDTRQHRTPYRKITFKDRSADVMDQTGFIHQFVIFSAMEDCFEQTSKLHPEYYEVLKSTIQHRQAQESTPLDLKCVKMQGSKNRNSVEYISDIFGMECNQVRTNSREFKSSVEHIKGTLRRMAKVFDDCLQQGEEDHLLQFLCDSIAHPNSIAQPRLTISQYLLSKGYLPRDTEESDLESIRTDPEVLNATFGSCSSQSSLITMVTASSDDSPDSGSNRKRSAHMSVCELSDQSAKRTAFCSLERSAHRPADFPTHQTVPKSNLL
jgi:hypothetical protein